MSEFDEKLNALLSNPDSMAQIMQLAQSLSGQGGGPAPQQQAAPPPPPPPPQTPPSPPSGGNGDILSALSGGLDPQMLTQEDHGAALQRAAQSAARGDTSEMARMVSQIMRSPEGAALVQRINKAVQK